MVKLCRLPRQSDTTVQFIMHREYIPVGCDMCGGGMPAVFSIHSSVVKLLRLFWRCFDESTGLDIGQPIGS